MIDVVGLHYLSDEGWSGEIIGYPEDGWWLIKGKDPKSGVLVVNLVDTQSLAEWDFFLDAKDLESHMAYVEAERLRKLNDLHSPRDEGLDPKFI